MGTFTATIDDREGATLSVRLEAESVDEPPPFGTDRMFAWQIVAQLAALPIAEGRDEAAQHIRSVTHFVDSDRQVYERPNHLIFGDAGPEDDDEEELAVSEVADTPAVGASLVARAAEGGASIDKVDAGLTVTRKESPSAPSSTHAARHRRPGPEPPRRRPSSRFLCPLRQADADDSRWQGEAACPLLCEPMS